MSPGCVSALNSTVRLQGTFAPHMFSWNPRTVIVVVLMSNDRLVSDAVTKTVTEHSVELPNGENVVVARGDGEDSESAVPAVTLTVKLICDKVICKRLSGCM